MRMCTVHKTFIIYVPTLIPNIYICICIINRQRKRRQRPGGVFFLSPRQHISRCFVCSPVCIGQEVRSPKVDYTDALCRVTCTCIYFFLPAAPQTIPHTFPPFAGAHARKEASERGAHSHEKFRRSPAPRHFDSAHFVHARTRVQHTWRIRAHVAE